jgi:exodeoxyribonuclease-3
MKMISWNVNGLRACLGKGFLESVAMLGPDILCLQETKMQQGQAEVDLPEYEEYWNSAEKKGYSGTAIFTKVKPLAVTYDMGIPHHDKEGRIITMELDDFFLVNVYTPNSQAELARLEYRMEW